MRKIVLILALSLALTGCDHKPTLRDQVLRTPHGADHVQECESIARTISPVEAKREGWTLDECYRAFL
jgi:hypothetical protein